MVNVDGRALPPVLAKLLAPWLEAIEVADPGMGDRVTAIAAHSSMTLLHRIELTPTLERTLVEARVATDSVAIALDNRRAVPPWIRNRARGALAGLIEALQCAEPNEVTKELGLGWKPRNATSAPAAR